MTEENPESRELEEHLDWLAHPVPQDHSDVKENVDHLDRTDFVDQMAFLAVQASVDFLESRAVLDRQVELVPQEGRDQQDEED